jgi:hypothetical protein
MAVEGVVSSAGLVCVGAMAVTDSVHALPAGLVGRTRGRTLAAILARCRLPSIGASLQCMYNIIGAGRAVVTAPASPAGRRLALRRRLP